MRKHTIRMLVVLVVVVGLVGAFAGVAVADDRTEADRNETAFDSENRSSAAHNDTLVDLGVGVETDEFGGSGFFDCVGEAATGHDCDKGFLIDLILLSVDYDGIMGGEIADLEYWFDDHFVINLLGQEVELALSCEMGLDGISCPADVDAELVDADEELIADDAP